MNDRPGCDQEIVRIAVARPALLLGRDGGRCLALCDHSLTVGEEESAHIQEAHQLVVHLICEVLELHCGSD